MFEMSKIFRVKVNRYEISLFTNVQKLSIILFEKFLKGTTFLFWQCRLKKDMLLKVPGIKKVSYILINRFPVLTNLIIESTESLKAIIEDERKSY